MLKKINYSAIKLDRELPVPLFSQLVSELQRLIADIPFSSREKLLSERKTAALLNIDRSTVNKAFAELEKLGIIHRSSARTLQLSPDGRRRNLVPFPDIGIIIPDDFSFRTNDENSQIPLEYIKGILDGAAENRHAVIMLQLPDINTPAAEITRFINDIGGRTAGIIHLGDRNIFPDSPLQKLVHCRELPQVIVSADACTANIIQVIPDIRPGTGELAKRLLALGLKKVGLLCATDESGKYIRPMPYFRYSSFQRPAAFRDIFQSMGLECCEASHMYSCNSYPEILKNLLQKMESGSLPQVYCCHNDRSARWLMHACKELGLRVPEDIAISGFDGLDAAETGELATIKLPFYEIGKKAVEVLLECCRNSDFDRSGVFTVPTAFIDGSTLSKNIKPIN